MLRVDTLRELFDAAETLASGLRINGDRLGILTNGGGLGVLAADTLESSGGKLAVLPPEVSRELDNVLPRAWSHANPVDILGDAQGDRYVRALDALDQPGWNDGLLVMNCPTGVADSLEAAQAVVGAKKKQPQRPMIACWMGHASTEQPRTLLSASGIPNYETPDEAVAAFLHLSEYARNQRALFETPSRNAPAQPKRVEDARQVLNAVLADGRSILTEPEAKAVLSAYNIPVVETAVASTPAEAAAVAERMGGPIALKILSRQISHKTDVGGVRLDLQGAGAVEQAAHDILKHVAAARPGALVEGFTVQQMVKRPHAQELLLGAMVDPTFGPCLLFGHGGVATEVIADRCIGLPPLNANLALDMISRTRVSKLLAGYRDRPPARLDTVAEALTALSDLVIDFPEISELDINPLLADAEGVIALDARIVVRPSDAQDDRLAVRPYPSDLVHMATIDGTSVRLRPIRPEDSDRLADMARRTDPEDLRLRFHGGLNVTSDAMTARLSQIDYDREMVFVAETPDALIGGVVRLVFDPNFESAECAIIVRSDLQNRKMGRTLLREALAYAQTRGARRLWGDVLAGNTRMLDLARELGGRLVAHPVDRRLTRVEFEASRRL
jgi:acetyltransferase